jgi:hypothetical protein
MKKQNSLFITIAIILMIFGCESNNENLPPNDFSLLTVKDGANDIELTPRLTWSVATDPEGDPVTYDLILDNNINPDTVIATSLNETEFIFNSPLQFSEKYYWKVVAKDSYGNTTESNVFSFTTIANKPPNDFLLLTLINGANDIELTPRLTWSVATDPEGDPVTYDLILDNNTNPDTVIATSLNETEFIFSSSLRYSEDFYWKVIAKDSYGNTTESDVFSFTTIDLFLKTTENAAFDGRLDHETIIFESKMWLIGGVDENINSKNDIWSSSDGTNWTQVTANANFSGRGSHSAITFNNKMWVIGGYSSGNRNDVWSSSDGASWTQMTSSANFSPRYAHTSVVFDDKIWVIGGEVGSLNVLSDIWNSSDGINWTQVSTITAPKKGRHTAVVFDNKIWLIGGLGQDGIKNDVWNSSDGITWIEVTSNAPFAKRYYHTSVVYDNKLWIIGGIGENNDMYNDIWNSSDGINWTKITSDAAFSKRDLHTSVIYNDKIWVIAGRDSNARKNDVWKMK